MSHKKVVDITKPGDAYTRLFSRFVKGIQSVGDSVPKTLVQILRSAMQDNLSPFDYSIWKSLACARASKLTSPEPVAKAKWQWGRVGWMLADHRCGLFLAWSSVDLSAGIQSAGDSVPKTLVQILHLAVEDNVSPFDLKIACLCQSIETKKRLWVKSYWVQVIACKQFGDMTLPVWIQTSCQLENMGWYLWRTEQFIS